jgi:hypothetical protein
VLLPRLISALASTATLATALTLLVAGGAGVAAYFTLARLLGVEELRLLGGIIRERLFRR